MTGTSEFTVEHDMGIEVGGENGVTLGADVTRSIVTDNVGSKNERVEHALTQCLARCSWVAVGDNFKFKCLHCQ